MAGVSVVTRKIKPKIPSNVETEKPKLKVKYDDLVLPNLIAIGVSSGGPNTLQIVFSKNFELKLRFGLITKCSFACSFLKKTIPH